MLDRDEDMLMTGTRHPFFARYKVGFTREGKIVAVSTDLYSNCGYSKDLSVPVRFLNNWFGINMKQLTIKELD